MEGFFIQVLNMGYQTGIVICFVIAARMVLHLLKAPKKYAYALWMIPFIRMICPVSIESVFSLLPKENAPIKANIGLMQTPQIYTSSKTVNAIVSQALPPATPAASVNPMQIYMLLFGGIWILGAAALIIYSVVSYIWLKRKLRCRIYVNDNIYYADYIHTPFVMGFRKPCIYLPFALDEKEMDFVVAHERVHIRRGDYLIKMLAFLVISVYWFQPLVWIAFFLFCRDMEMSCDEAVMKQYGEERKKEYATTLLNLTAGKRRIAGIPLAFGEGNTKQRIKNIMNYKKAIAVTAVIAVLLIVCLMIGLLTNPKQDKAAKDPSDNVLQTESESETIAEANTDRDTETETDAPQMIAVTSPAISPEMNLGADGMSLDYAGNGRVIFHGYFGLFVFDTESQDIIAAVDLASIGCSMTQGDSYCEVMVTADGEEVYLHPMGEKEMYRYSVLNQTLEKAAFSLEGISLFDSFEESSNFIEGHTGFYSGRRVVMEVNGFKYYGYLASYDNTVGDLTYVEDDMVFLIFGKFFGNTNQSEDNEDQMMDSGIYAMEFKEVKSDGTGVVFEIYNNSDQPLIYGAYYKLQRKENSKWVDVPYIIDNWGFNDMAYEIEANTSAEIVEDWEWLYGKLPEGQYLMVKYINILGSDGNYDSLSLGGEFQIPGK